MLFRFSNLILAIFAPSYFPYPVQNSTSLYRDDHFTWMRPHGVWRTRLLVFSCRRETQILPVAYIARSRILPRNDCTFSSLFSASLGRRTAPGGRGLGSFAVGLVAVYLLANCPADIVRGEPYRLVSPSRFAYPDRGRARGLFRACLGRLDSHCPAYRAGEELCRFSM